MKRHQQIVLQQWIGPRPVEASGWRETREWIRRSGHEPEEKHTNNEHR